METTLRLRQLAYFVQKSPWAPAGLEPKTFLLPHCTTAAVSLLLQHMFALRQPNFVTSRLLCICIPKNLKRAQSPWLKEQTLTTRAGQPYESLRFECGGLLVAHSVTLVWLNAEKNENCYKMKMHSCVQSLEIWRVRMSKQIRRIRGGGILYHLSGYPGT